MPNKKKGKGKGSGFMQFALELRDRNPQKYRSVPDAVAAAGLQWPHFSAEQKKVYDDRARLEKQNCLGGADVKYTSEGIPVEEIERQDNEMQRAIQAMKNDIKSTLEQAKSNDTLKDMTFLIVHFNVLFQTNQNRWYSCEVAIAPFSLEKGVYAENIFHYIIKPGTLPLGYRHEAKQRSEEHQLLEEVIREPIEDNTKEVFKNMISFMSKFKTKDGQLPILYTREEKNYINGVRTIIADFSYDFGFAEQIQVYSLEQLFLNLKNACAGLGKKWPTEAFSFSCLDRDPYSHTQDISCEYHDQADVTEHCSRARAIRYGYVICDNCCSDLGIALIPGRHVPHTARVRNPNARIGSIASSVVSEPVSISAARPASVAGSAASRRPVERTMLKFPPRPGQAK